MKTVESTIAWQDLLELHVVRKLREIVRRRFRVDLAFADHEGKRVDGPAEQGACARIAIDSVRENPRTVFFNCPHHQRREVASPVLIDGQLWGAAYAACSPLGDDDFLAELTEL